MSGLENWSVTRSSVSESVFVPLSWNAASDVDNLGTLTSANWPGSQWNDMGGTAIGSVSVGTITSTVAGFGVFTLGSTDSQKPLPFELISFIASTSLLGLELQWSTASELNNDFFEVQPSVDQ